MITLINNSHYYIKHENMRRIKPPRKHTKSTWEAGSGFSGLSYAEFDFWHDGTILRAIRGPRMEKFRILGRPFHRVFQTGMIPHSERNLNHLRFRESDVIDSKRHLVVQISRLFRNHSSLKYPVKIPPKILNFSSLGPSETKNKVSIGQEIKFCILWALNPAFEILTAQVSQGVSASP